MGEGGGGGPDLSQGQGRYQGQKWIPWRPNIRKLQFLFFFFDNLILIHINLTRGQKKIHLFKKNNNYLFASKTGPLTAPIIEKQLQ